jgi:hypothetical protein
LIPQQNSNENCITYKKRKQRKYSSKQKHSGYAKGEKMIDTAHLRFPYRLPLDILSKWPHHDRNRNGETFRRSISGGISVIYHTHDPRGMPNSSIIFGFSCPKLIHDCNHHLVQDLRPVIDHANAIIHTMPEFSSIQVEEGVLSRIDVCCHHYVGDIATDYLDAFRGLEYPHREAYPYPHRGAEFRSKSAKLIFYDKALECGHEAVAGVIRQEEQIRDKRRIGELLGKKNPTLLDINKDFAVRTLKNGLLKLRLNGAVISNRESAAERLITTYGPTKGNNLYGFWQMRQEYSKRDLQTRFGYSPESVNMKERMIANAGIALTSSKVILPPLEVDL